ncbi:DUF6756 family protein [Deinococcus alpinitundrae]|uniref:DUF6756 family protein n=1 Tax=Deinococcus alpinitundrae TaxID=468913 RepID=UPI0027B99662|nr:DUF6756 family protein [Deinococcus alpinitundrae]
MSSRRCVITRTQRQHDFRRRSSVAKDFQWLLCENHHNVLIGVGPQIAERLRVAETILTIGSEPFRQQK